MKGLPKGLKGRDGPRPVHGEEEQPRRRLADVVDVKILWRRQRHNKLEKKRKNVRVFFKSSKSGTPVALGHRYLEWNMNVREQRSFQFHHRARLVP